MLVDADGVDEDELLLAAADAGADDVEPRRLELPGHRAAPRTSPRCARRSRPPGIDVESAELSMVPKTTVAIEDEATAKKVVRLIDALEENDDVQDVYANFDIPEHVLEAVAT